MKPLYSSYVDPEDKQNLTYWSRKWNCSPAEIKEAIINTGSLDPKKIKAWLKKDDLLYHPLEGAKFLVRKTFDAIF